MRTSNRRFVLRSAALTVSALGLTLLFQNCAPPTQSTLCAKGQPCSSGSTTSASTANTGINSSTTRTGTTASTGSSGDITSTSPFTPAGTGTTSPPGTGGPMLPPVTNSAGMTFYKNLPSTLNVEEFATFQLDIAVGGGTTPYTYEWYRNDVRISTMTQLQNLMYETADSYNKEGNYKVIVKDATGASLTSATTRVAFTEPQVGCSASSYTMMAGNDPTGMAKHELYQNSRGIFMLHAGDPRLNGYMSYPAYFGISVYTMSAASYLEKRYLTCQSHIPRMNDVQQYLNSKQYQATGQVTLECRNHKWKLVSNTCRWTEATDHINNPACPQGVVACGLSSTSPESAGGY